MAYNPFNIFRRNQKALFAVLTVFIMIMFTLSFGSGDAIQRFTQWLGGRKGDAVCKIDGSAITDRDVATVRRGRVMANSFMNFAAGETLDNLRRYTDQQRGKLSERAQRLATDVQMVQFAITNPESARSLGLPPIGQSIYQAQIQLQAVAEDPSAKSEDKDAARTYRAQLELLVRQVSGRGLYFTNAPNQTTRDVIEFMLWEKKADQLGIRFTREDVNTLIGREFYGFFKSDVEVRKALQKQIEGFNFDACLDAVAIEFKVRAAQAAVLGPTGKAGPGAPVYSTPYEMFEYYRDQCSPAKYEVIGVPYQAFLDDVKGDPSESELKALYDKSANDEPNPAKEGFGFKEPRKLAIDWIALTGEEPYYQKLAEEQVKVGEAMAQASGLTAVPVPGVGGAWAQAAAAPLALKAPAVDAAYATAVSQFKFQLQNEYSNSNPFFPRDVLQPNVVRPATPVAALAGLMGQTTPFGSPIQATALAIGAPCAYEVQTRRKTGLPLLFGTIPGPGAFQTMMGGAAGYKLVELQPLPIEALRPELLKTTIKERARELAFGKRPNRFDPTTPTEKGDVTRFTEELEKLSEKGRAKDKTAVNEYIKKFKAERGLTTPGAQFGSTTLARDEWNLEDDPGMLPLVLAQKESLGHAFGAHGSRYMPFGRSFFWTQRRDGLRQPTAGLYAATQYPPDDRSGLGDESNRPRYVYWVTEDVQPKKTSFLTTKDQVRAAWKHLKARELAKQRAEAMAETIRKESTTSQASLGLTLHEMAGKLQKELPPGSKAESRATVFPLNNVCPLTPFDLSSIPPATLQQMIAAGQNPFGQLVPFGLSESQNIPYPTRDMVSALLDNRDKPFKTVLVLPDDSKDTYYVAVLTSPANDPLTQKQPSTFARDVYSRTGPQNAVLGDFMQEEMRQSRQSVVALLKKEFRYEETDEQTKKLDENAKSGGRD